MFATDTDMIWWKRGNFLSLLNLCDQIKSFGSIRWYWDGSRERFIQFVKPFMSNMRNTSSYLKIQYNRVQQSNLLNDLLQTYDTSISDEPSYMRYNNMTGYHDIEYLTQIIQQNEAFLCLYDSTIMADVPPASFCLVKNEFKGYYKIDIVCNDDDGTHKCGQWYSAVNIDPLDVEHDQYNWCDNVIK